MTDTPPASAHHRTWADVAYLLLLRMPDLRAYVATALFVLTAGIFEMIWMKPELTSNQGFMFLAQAVIVSGLIGGVVAFLFASSKSSADIRDQVGKALEKIPQPPKDHSQ